MEKLLNMLSTLQNLQYCTRVGTARHKVRHTCFARFSPERLFVAPGEVACRVLWGGGEALQPIQPLYI